MTEPDFLIVGGGIIGLLTARHLAETLADTTARIVLLERGTCGREASWAGGGIVSPLYPWQQPDAICHLAVASQAMYPRLAADLLAATGIDCEFRRRGLLYLAPEDDARALAWAERFGQRMDALDAKGLARLAPAVAPAAHSLSMPELGSIRNPRLCKALRADLATRRQVTIHEHTPVTAVRAEAGTPLQVETAGQTWTSGATIVCGGAWTQQLLAPLGASLPVSPVKGQMLLFDTTTAHADTPLLSHVVLSNGRYLIPRDDGRVLVGSTLEPEAGFDQTTTAEAAASLRESAIAILPALADCPITHHWAGLRPGSPEGIPQIGAVPGLDGLYVNAGHYRNGLVLAPAATRLLVDQLLGNAPLLDPSAYQPTGGHAAQQI